jgi:sugar lactone lactonase YvrE
MAGPTGLELVAESERQWTGVAVSSQGRIFVNFPRWSKDVPVSVAEITESGDLVPYPDAEWNDWDGAGSPRGHFVCVQSVFVDGNDFLWILDPANELFGGVVAGGPKLLKVDLETDQVIQTIFFDPSVAPQQSYLNDIRIDLDHDFAYLTESGTGALVAVDLRSGRSRRLLADHPSTKSEGIVLTIGGHEWRGPGGNAPDIHSDGLALDPAGEYLYYQALTGHSLYRIATQWLRDRDLSGVELTEKVELVAASGAADGIAFAPDGNLYLSALEHDAIRRLTPEREVETVVEDPLLAWPDSFAIGPEGWIYVTTSQIHLGPARKDPYRIFRFKPAD